MAKNKTTGETHSSITVISPSGVVSMKLSPNVIIDGKVTVDTTDPKLGVQQ